MLLGGRGPFKNHGTAAVMAWIFMALRNTKAISS